MDFASYFPVWNKLTSAQQDLLSRSAQRRSVPKGIEGTADLKITHEKIANHLGTAREVVTRMLRYFQSEGMVKLTRGGIEITNAKKLRNLTD